VDDDRHTGVAYSWLHTTDPTAASNSDFLFDRRTIAGDVWIKAYEANRRLAAMHDAFIRRIVEICPLNGAYLDFACNSGYFPVRASLAGVRTAVAIDHGDYSGVFRILNEITGASAKFILGGYDSSRHTIRTGDDSGIGTYDVVSISAVLCHLPDPLRFLKAIAGLASKAVFIWNGFLDSEELLIRYNPVNKFYPAEFPNGFDDDTRISIPLLHLSMTQLGFAHHEELEIAPDWPPEWWIRPAGLHTFLFWK
jgi:SAM-dependent methyltransferase